MRVVYEALIVGGGPAGASAALLLAQAGWSVALVERKIFPRRKVCGEYLSATNWPLLELLGVAKAFDQQAGPDVRRVGLFAGQTVLQSSLPLPSQQNPRWGRALAREHLDALLLARAAEAGATVLQPWRAETIAHENEEYVCEAACESSPERATLRAPVVIAAHGSWDSGSLPSQLPRRPAAAHDLLGFKAHFSGGHLPDDLMPLLSFPGGYGGLVHSDRGLTSLSCCVRRDLLESLPRDSAAGAGPAVLRHILATTPGLRDVLSGAQEAGRWLSAGPIRPGIRPAYVEGVFRVGNAVGEAHPVVAEGISMAMQSAWLLTERLIAARASLGDRAARDAVAVDYQRAWLASFAPRIRTAALVAEWAMRPLAVGACLPLLRCFPRVLTWGARLSGKTRQVVTS